MAAEIHRPPDAGLPDTTDRAADVLTGPDDDTTLGAGGATVSRTYHPTEGREHLSGLFASRADAQNAVGGLEALGVPRSDISVILRSESETADFAAATGTTGLQSGGVVVVADAPAHLAGEARALLTGSR